MAVPRRVATLSVHTSPLDQPGGGDAGGMNVWVTEVSRELARRGIQVEIFTRATSSDLPPTVELTPGVLVRHVTAGPFEGLDKGDLPAQLCAFTSAVLRAEAAHDPGWYDLVHSHYWLSGQVGWLAKERWGVPLVHSMHTMAKVKNAALAAGDDPEPALRAIGEAQVVEAADALLASTPDEAAVLVDLYGADPARTRVVPPGVDLEVFSPGGPDGGGRSSARRRLGLAPDAVVLAFAGRIQPLKAPEVLLEAAALLLGRRPRLRDRLTVAVIGAPSGTGLAEPERLHKLAVSLGIADVVRFERPVPQRVLADWYRAADLTVVPSYSESFGLVAIESAACATPVVAARVGGLVTAVTDGETGVLVDGHDPDDYATVIGRLLDDPRRRAELAAAGVARSAGFGWSATTDRLVELYASL